MDLNDLARSKSADLWPIVYSLSMIRPCERGKTGRRRCQGVVDCYFFFGGGGWLFSFFKKKRQGKKLSSGVSIYKHGAKPLLLYRVESLPPVFFFFLLAFYFLCPPPPRYRNERVGSAQERDGPAPSARSSPSSASKAQWLFRCSGLHIRSREALLICLVLQLSTRATPSALEAPSAL